MSYKKFFKITSKEQGFKIDRFLINQGLAFSLIQKLIRKKLIKINGVKAKISDRLEVDDEIQIFANIDFKEIKQKQPKIDNSFLTSIKKSIIFQDDNLIVINKASGIAVQGGSGIKIAIDDILPGLKFNLDENPKLVHRIDKDTSGILLLARNRKSADFLSEAFKNKTIKKTYLALVKGVPAKKNGVINFPLLKKYQGVNEKVYRDDINGKEAITFYNVIKSYPNDTSLVEVNPVTGRTHQIRVHLKEIGHPIIGDFKYGSKNTNFDDLKMKKRLYLHAFKIEISPYFNSTKLEVCSDKGIKPSEYLNIFK